MNKSDPFCPYCGAPVIMDHKGRGLCECCGQWIVYDENKNKNVLEQDYRSGNSKRAAAAGGCCVLPVITVIMVITVVIAGLVIIL